MDIHRARPCRRSLRVVVRGLVLVLALGVAGTAVAGVDPSPSPGAPATAPIATPGPGVRVGPALPEPVTDPSTQPAIVTEQPAPVSLRIDAIDVDTTLLALGLQDDGTLEVPPAGFPAGWYTGAPRPGALGPAVVAGHVDWGGEPGVFWALRDLRPGDRIEITREDGSVAVFRTVELEQVAKDAFPTERVYGDQPTAALRVITCSGDFDTSAGSYRDNLVAYADLVEIRPAPTDDVTVP